MGNSKAVEVEGLITKNYIKSKVKRSILLTRPELSNKITDKVVSKCLIYISGYIKCIQYHGIQPINESELKSLLTLECLDWIVGYVDKGGK